MDWLEKIAKHLRGLSPKERMTAQAELAKAIAQIEARIKRTSLEQNAANNGRVERGAARTDV